MTPIAASLCISRHADSYLPFHWKSSVVSHLECILPIRSRRGHFIGSVRQYLNLKSVWTRSAPKESSGSKTTGKWLSVPAAGAEDTTLNKRKRRLDWSAGFLVGGMRQVIGTGPPPAFFLILSRLIGHFTFNYPCTKICEANNEQTIFFYI